MLLISYQAYSSYMVTTFDPGAFPYSDSQLGIDGYAIENFEDDVLAPGLSIFFGAYTSQGSHQFSADDLTQNPALAWDGDSVLHHDSSFYSVFFKFDHPVSSFDIYAARGTT